jgi:hypothetical protein
MLDPSSLSLLGDYWLYVQVKRGGVVETIALDVLAANVDAALK